MFRRNKSFFLPHVPFLFGRCSVTVIIATTMRKEIKSQIQSSASASTCSDVFNWLSGRWEILTAAGAWSGGWRQNRQLVGGGREKKRSKTGRPQLLLQLAARIDHGCKSANHAACGSGDVRTSRRLGLASLGEIRALLAASPPWKLTFARSPSLTWCICICKPNNEKGIEKVELN